MLIELVSAALAADPSALDATPGWGDTRWGAAWDGGLASVVNGESMGACRGSYAPPAHHPLRPCPGAPAEWHGLTVRYSHLHYGWVGMDQFDTYFDGNACTVLTSVFGPGVADDAGSLTWTGTHVSATAHHCLKKSSYVTVVWLDKPIGKLENLASKAAFRDVAWGAPPPPGFVKQVTNDDGTVVYSRPDEDPMIGDAPITSVGWGFRDGGLASVSILTGADANDALLRALIAQFGPPVQADPLVKSFVWHTDALELTHKVSPKSGYGTTVFTSNPAKRTGGGGL